MGKLQSVLQPRRDILHGQHEQGLRHARGGGASFGTPGEAEPEYTSLLADLDSKYGRVKDIRREEETSADGTRRGVTYTGSDGAVCTVSPAAA